LEATKVPSALVGPLHWLTSGTTTNATWSSDEVDVYRVVLQAGHTYTFSLNGAGGGLDPALSLLNSGLTVVASNDDVAYPSNLNSSITYTAISSGEYYLGAYEVNSQPGAYSLTITDSSASDTILSTAATSQSVAIGGASVNSTIAYAGDHDWVRVTLTAGQSYVFTMNGSGGTPLTDPFLALRVHPARLWPSTTMAAPARTPSCNSPRRPAEPIISTPRPMHRKPAAIRSARPRARRRIR